MYFGGWEKKLIINISNKCTYFSILIKLQCVEIDVFRIVQRYLTKSNFEFHTHPLPEERVLRIIIKGLSNDITESEITDELATKGHDIKSILQFYNSVWKFPIYLITLDSNPGN